MTKKEEYERVCKRLGFWQKKIDKNIDIGLDRVEYAVLKMCKSRLEGELGL